MLCYVYSLLVTSAILKLGHCVTSTSKNKILKSFFVTMGKKEGSAFYKSIHKLLSTTRRCAAFTLDGFLEFL